MLELLCYFALVIYVLQKTERLEYVSSERILYVW